MSEPYPFEDFQHDWQASQAQGVEYQGARLLDRQYWEFRYFERRYGKGSAKAKERSHFCYCVHRFLEDSEERLKKEGFLSKDVAHKQLKVFDVDDDVFRQLLTFSAKELFQDSERVLGEVLKRLDSSES